MGPTGPMQSLDKYGCGDLIPLGIQEFWNAFETDTKGMMVNFMGQLGRSTVPSCLVKH